ncbi:Exosome component 10 [Portunus trituberculatus]|uniref:Exosome component 10 n=1 Tax=Portunus trituberculatus TaxID=210409 RepID=A0A5B7GFQ7_PORTR|nr:Exosome component 10 [Portunus trituberculatus]
MILKVGFYPTSQEELPGVSYFSVKTQNSDIDEASGLKKNANAELLDPVIKKVQGPSSLQIGGKNVVLLASRNVQKPQLFFSEKVQNSAKEPFIPILKEKPNSLKPLSILLCLDAYGRDYNHPYEYELQYWVPAASQLTPVEPQSPKALDETPLTMVNTEEELAAMVAKLKACSEFAVDLEVNMFYDLLHLHCSNYGYLFVCTCVIVFS